MDALPLAIGHGLRNHRSVEVSALFLGNHCKLLSDVICAYATRIGPHRSGAFLREPHESDYWMVGTGAAGMAFTDALPSQPDATVTMVDLRLAPGGQWIDTYPFVRLQTPPAFCGMSSVPMGCDTLDRSGLNAGFRQAAGADALRAYYARVMGQHFLPTGRVRHIPCSHHAIAPDGSHRITSRLRGVVREVLARRNPFGCGRGCARAAWPAPARTGAAARR